MSLNEYISLLAKKHPALSLGDTAPSFYLVLRRQLYDKKATLQLTNSSVTFREKLLEEAELFRTGPGMAKAENTHVHREPVIAALGVTCRTNVTTGEVLTT